MPILVNILTVLYTLADPTFKFQIIWIFCCIEKFDGYNFCYKLYQLYKQYSNYMIENMSKGPLRELVRFRWFFELWEFELKEFSCKSLLGISKVTEEFVRFKWSV